MKPVLTIAVVTETYPPEVNGVAHTIGHLVQGLRQRGHQVQVIRPQQNKRDLPDCETRQVLVRGVGIPRYQELKLGLPAKRRLLRLWREQTPDLVHIVTEGPLGASALRAARMLGLPVSSGFHTNFHSYSRHYGLGFMSRLVAGYLRSLHNQTDCTIVPTQAMRQQLSDRGFNNLAVVGRGIDTTLFNPARRSAAQRAAWGCKADELVLLYVGRLAREKNLDLFVTAAHAMRQRNRETKVVLVGDGPAGAALRRAHPEFVFAGMQTGEALAGMYASADVFLFPSLSETFGNVTLEALVSGLAVVAFDYAAAAEVIQQGVCGLLAACDDPDQFIAAAVSLAIAPERVAGLRRAARAAAEGLSWERIYQEMEFTLGEVIQRHRLSRTVVGVRPYWRRSRS